MKGQVAVVLQPENVGALAHLHHLDFILNFSHARYIFIAVYDLLPGYLGLHH